MLIRGLLKSDWSSVKEIYQQGIDTELATFETTIPTWESWIEARIQESCIVLEVDEKVVGWAALSPYSSRCVYEGVGEVSIYVASESRGHGYGKLLLQKLIEKSEALGIWTLQAGIFPENTASLKLHFHFGFRTLGTSEKLGILNGEWKDVMHLERRSSVI
jgi:L-amino acid N-acyltransferase YncA